MNHPGQGREQQHLFSHADFFIAGPGEQLFASGTVVGSELILAVAELAKAKKELCDRIKILVQFKKDNAEAAN